ncbi:MAG: DoxX family protein [Ignavibacteriales bacterium]|nr:DoxX family protein [Ignavibacteriales bacterium]
MAYRTYAIRRRGHVASSPGNRQYFSCARTAKWSMWGMEASDQMPSSMLTIMKILSIAEPLGGLAMILGFLTPLAAVGLSIVMLGAINMKIFAWGLKFMEM